MSAVARYNDISSKADRGDIFIRAAAGRMCPKQDFIVVPPPSNIMEVKNKTPTICHDFGLISWLLCVCVSCHWYVFVVEITWVLF